MQHNVILVLLDGLNYQVAHHAMGHLHAYVEADRAALYRVECELPSLSRPLYECILTGVPPIDSGIVQWTFDNGKPAGAGTDTLPGSPVLYIPLRAPMRIRGVLAVQPGSSRWLLIPEQRRQLDTFATLTAIAIERVHYVDIAQLTTVQIESERLRNSLLSALSHDLRTPLTALMGLAEYLTITKPELSGEQREVAAVGAGAGSAQLAQRAVHRDDVDHVAAGPQVGQAQVRQVAVDRHAQDLTVEVQHARLVVDPQHDVVEAQDGDGVAHPAILARG